MPHLPRTQLLFLALLLSLPSLGRTAPADAPTVADIVFAALKAKPAATLTSRATASPPPQPEPKAMTLRMVGVEDAKPLPSTSPYALPPTAQPGQ